MDINYYKKYEPIDGKWYITNEIGSGAFGTVFEITRKDFPDMKAALKVISIPTSQKEINNYREENYDLDEKSVTSYFESIVDDVTKEFRLMAQLKGNTNIVGYEDHDVKQKDGEFGWDIFIRMELLTPMNRYFAENNPTQKDVIQLGIDICKALEICQKYQIIHRDIKPSNIFVSKTGDFKLGDFGVARTLEKTTNGLSKKGTYTYMAPEVFKGESYNSNVDIYSLGILMYKLLNNNMEPFRTDRTYGDSEKAFEKRVLGASIPAPANAKGRLAEIVLKACSFSPKERYESPLQMRAELENILYSDCEKQITYPEGDVVGYEASTNGKAEEKTVSLFGDFTEKEDKKENKTISVFDIKNEEENKVEEKVIPQNKKSNYEVILNRRQKSFEDNAMRAIDVYVDDKMAKENILSKKFSLQLPEGHHKVVLKLSMQQANILKYVDKVNKIMAFGKAKTEIQTEVNGTVTIDYRISTASGGIELVESKKETRKNKLVALLLAIFPYTGIFGGYHFYLNDRQGVLRLCTLNFLTIGWLMDIITAIIKLFTKDE